MQKEFQKKLAKNDGEGEDEEDDEELDLRNLDRHSESGHNESDSQDDESEDDSLMEAISQNLKQDDMFNEDNHDHANNKDEH